MAARIAIPASERPASGAIGPGPGRGSGDVIHNVTVTGNTASVARSPALSGPSFAHSSRTYSRPPSISVMCEGNITVVFRNHASGRNASIAGTPIAIHSRKPMRMPEVCSTKRTRMPLGGDPMIVPRPPIDAA